jgi:hypothetical protein
MRIRKDRTGDLIVLATAAVTLMAIAAYPSCTFAASASEIKSKRFGSLDHAV